MLSFLLEWARVVCFFKIPPTILSKLWNLLAESCLYFLTTTLMSAGISVTFLFSSLVLSGGFPLRFLTHLARGSSVFIGFVVLSIFLLLLFLSLLFHSVYLLWVALHYFNQKKNINKQKTNTASKAH